MNSFTVHIWAIVAIIFLAITATIGALLTTSTVAGTYGNEKRHWTEGWGIALCAVLATFVFAVVMVRQLAA